MLKDKVEHVVVLMLENRSFDSMLGWLYKGKRKGDFEGLTGNETNPYNGENIPIKAQPGTDNKVMTIPSPDPGELWNDMNQQLFGLKEKPSLKQPPMDGFVENYMRQTEEPGKYKPESMMHYYLSDAQLPVLSSLAKQFAVCDHWFASAPCQTWPNRFFLHCATADGYENNSPVHFPYLMNTVFNRMEEAKESWGIYFHDFPQTMTLTRLWTHLDHFHFIDDFFDAAGEGELPAYSFIEPQYFPGIDSLPNDQHPPHNVSLGEQLIAKVYNAVRGSKNWEKTLLIITYDEHGGCYDHVPPPNAVPPGNTPTHPFNFDRYGVRVPTVLISPYIKPGTILKAPGGSAPYDHTSIIATLRKRFNLGGALTNRDAVAPDFESVFNLDAPDNDGLSDLKGLDYVATKEEIEAAKNAPMNGFQKAMHEAAAHLPSLKDIEEGEPVFKRIDDHIENFVKGLLLEVSDHKAPKDALLFMNQQLDKFMPGKIKR